MTQRVSVTHEGEGAISEELATMTRERDALLARLRRLEAQRAQLVSDALLLIADPPADKELPAELERLVDGLIGLELRAVEPDAAEAAATPVDEQTTAVDVVVLADATPQRTRYCLDILRSRTRSLQRLWLIAHPGGPDRSQLEELAADIDAPAVTLAEAGAPALVDALNEGTAPLVAMISARVAVTHGWCDALAACLRGDERIGAAAPLVTGDDGPTTLRLPLGLRLDLDGTARLLRRTRVAPVEVEQLAGACIVLRREALAALETPFDAQTVEAAVQDAGARLNARGWRLAVAPDALVEMEPVKSASAGRRRGAPARDTITALLAPRLRQTAGVLHDADVLSSGIAEALHPVWASAPIVYVVPEGHWPRSANGADIDVRGLRACGASAQLLLLGDENGPGEGAVTARVDLDGLTSALQGAGVAIAADPSIVELVAAAARRRRVPCGLVISRPRRHAPERDVVLLPKTLALWSGLAPQSRARAIALTPVIDDTIFHPATGSAASAAGLAVTFLLRRGSADRAIAALRAVRDQVGDGAHVMSIGSPLHTLLHDDMSEDAWHKHHLPTGRADHLAQALGSTDIFVDLEAPDVSGHTTMAAMACGAVVLTAATPTTIEISRGGTQAILIDRGDVDAAVEAVCTLAADWPRMRQMRAASLGFGRTHGLVAAGANRLAAFAQFVGTHAERRRAAVPER